MKVIYNFSSVKYEFSGHPESPSRIKIIYESLKDKFEIEEYSQGLDYEEILKVHTRDLFEKVKNGEFIDYDTPNNKEMFRYAVLSVGSALKCVEYLLKGERSFSLSRPPGHHALKDRAGGFCYFNNIGIAVNKILENGKKVLILDLDVHHGNGTEDIFLDRENVLYVSIHQSPLYPGTGLKNISNSYNFPLPPGTDIKTYMEKLEEIEKILKDFSPDYLAISLGLDTLDTDPLGGFALKWSDFYEIGKKIYSWGVPLFVVLEGGYGPDIGRACREFLRGVDGR
ncbi:MAG: histone deacetylase [Caldiserica bacterium]|mgnify:CR=1 FL=1|nr:MAG: histone deacetylase [Caldisericota bacterium]